ncbi:hypothetical protein ISP15_05860 [Dyella jejuensis]|uniref:Uncharacterized protein n=1 Tax=Dyella jejuensis TaxID=1432009 RepID=A0ABW8JFK4_9GAMM
MQQFIPFEDDWDALEQLRPGMLVPYRVGFIPAREPERWFQGDGVAAWRRVQPVDGADR